MVANDVLWVNGGQSGENFILGDHGSVNDKLVTCSFVFLNGNLIANSINADGESLRIILFGRILDLGKHFLNFPTHRNNTVIQRILTSQF